MRLPHRLLIAIWVLLPFTASAETPANRLTYALGGLMSPPSKIDIDLDTGQAVVMEQFGFDSQAKKTTRQFTLLSIQSAELRKRAKEALAAGLESESCKTASSEGQFTPPNADAIVFMTVLLDGQAANAPTQGSCWSPAALKLEEAMYKATHSTLKN